MRQQVLCRRILQLDARGFVEESVFLVERLQKSNGAKHKIGNDSTLVTIAVIPAKLVAARPVPEKLVPANAAMSQFAVAALYERRKVLINKIRRS